jgi:hypothetical protein
VRGGGVRRCGVVNQAVGRGVQGGVEKSVRLLGKSSEDLD